MVAFVGCVHRKDMTPEKFETQFWKWVDNMPAMTTYQTGRTVTGTKDTAMAAWNERLQAG